MKSKEKNKKILVTGGAGFIGSHLCDYLLTRGNKVTCVDNFYSGSKDNIRHLLSHPNFKFIEHDIINPFFLEVDEIYNLACPASPISYQFDPVYTIKTNVLGAVNMLELARTNGAKIMQASTSEIYGDPLEHPQKETYCGNIDPTGPRSCYDEGKRAAETLFSDYAREFNVNIRIVRIFNTYGPKMALDDGRVISNFIIQALKNEDITIYGRGNQTRSFMYIDDLIAGMAAMMENSDFGGPINLGNPNEMTIKKLAQMIIKLTGSGSKIIYLPEVTNDPQKRRPDISLAKEKLNWRPRVDFETGLKKTIEYFKERVKNKTNILVFSTVYDDPIEGNLEKNVKDLVREMPNFHFHIIAGKFRSDLPKIHQGENFTIYRVGIGGNLDKYLLALIGPFKAMKLHKSHKFPLAWSIRATYGSLAALIFKFFSKVPFMVLFHQADLAKAEHRKVRLIWPIYKLILKKSGAIHLPDDIFIKEQRSAGDYEIIPFSTESTLEIRKVKEIHHKIIHKLNKKLVKPK
ncbi:MAG: hypothetical protein UW50_C0001G0233 [Candidatus Wolfebacteria bacterium GW2011_GWA1_44_24]|uniref:UDP-glucuronate decarboxylase n=1 Tax=Candidatus Wolfebacteria bacterium GW2011_GWB1_41_12 TaxID=1619006 RepID=A0A0G0UK48_9BACT|nr:MAG: hypothetical protein UU38_C0001G0045 [Candidatus Wolfebacteria bacterium GW2011_GWB1_41_12]KKT56664.1 MAG: hypothetical protein UW50_C0001G0233 [Candidatus Wolfebacteria bacterium GW2011_GWA1_44_24]